MAAPRRMTRQVQIGLSHSEKAKKLSYNGFYAEALKELNIALRAFEAENRDGLWDDAVAGVLNNAGFVYLFLGAYQSSEDTFLSARAIKERFGDRRSIAGTLAGLADAYRGQGRFEEAAALLDEALDLALALKDHAMARTILVGMDALERTRCDMPDAAHTRADFDELYVPAAGSGVSARVAHLGIVFSNNEVRIEADIGFPYLMKDLGRVDRDGSQPFPVLAFLFPRGVESELARVTVTDEEELAVGFSASSFDGILYGPGSYHRDGPLPMPACKQYLYTYGAGHILGWDLGANGWYHVEASIKVDPGEKFTFLIALPFASVKLRSVSLLLADQDAWSTVKLALGTFKGGRTIDTASSAFFPGRELYRGPAKGALRLDPGIAMKFGVLCLDLMK